MSHLQSTQVLTMQNVKGDKNIYMASAITSFFMVSFGKYLTCFCGSTKVVEAKYYILQTLLLKM